MVKIADFVFPVKKTHIPGCISIPAYDTPRVSRSSGVLLDGSDQARG